MTRFVVVLLLWSIVPGMAEALENAAHWVREGHFAHQESDTDSHSDPGPEHGCTGTFHTCPCHSSAAANQPSSLREVRAPNTDSESARRLFNPPLMGYPHGIYHPPQL
jgi:hypothetical protein